MVKPSRLKQPVEIYDEDEGGGSTTGTWGEFNQEKQGTSICFSLHLLSLRFIWPEQVPAAVQDDRGMQTEMTALETGCSQANKNDMHTHAGITSLSEDFTPTRTHMHIHTNDACR